MDHVTPSSRNARKGPEHGTFPQPRPTGGSSLANGAARNNCPPGPQGNAKPGRIGGRKGECKVGRDVRQASRSMWLTEWH
ncbi:hypothetical protein ZHAS_00016425 [Anopheles sinensis]|uniref:Uncharacterized protein n=1 Tax=Anopheles sinensis TaxID=74873 RepID=A0A084WE00_ANOSI|nr:hypothetical protein ZHAS_00016425 [Anopheles sinensis]